MSNGAERPRLNRRRFLAIAGVVGSAQALGLLAACQQAPAAAPTTAAKPTTAPAAQATAAPQPAAAASPAAQPKSLEKITLRTDFLPWGAHSAFYLALERGYYAAEGLDVTIADGRGSPVTVQTVGGGTDPIGFAAMSATALGIGEGLPVRSVAMFTNRNAYGIVFDEKADYKSLADFYGKRVIIIASGPELAQTQAVFRINGLDEKQVQFTNVEAASKWTLYAGGQGDAVVGPVPFSAAIQPKRPSKVLYFADFGLNLQDYNLFANTDFIKTNPTRVAAFVRASAKGWQDAQKDAKAAAEALVKRRTDTDLNAILGQTELQLKFLFSKRTQGKPIGWASDEDWKDGLAILKDYAGLKGDTADLKKFFTNEFVPS